MKLPHGERAVVDLRKLQDYCLDPAHPRGRHKARVFAAKLGLRSGAAAWLRHRLLEAAATQPARPAEEDEYGRRFVIDLTVTSEGRSAMVRSAWIIRRGDDHPRLTTCFVL